MLLPRFSKTYESCQHAHLPTTTLSDCPLAECCSAIYQEQPEGQRLWMEKRQDVTKLRKVLRALLRPHWQNNWAGIVYIKDWRSRRHPRLARKKKSAFCWEGANPPTNIINPSYVGVVECINAWGMENFLVSLCYSYVLWCRLCNKLVWHVHIVLRLQKTHTFGIHIYKVETGRTTFFCINWLHQYTVNDKRESDDFTLRNYLLIRHKVTIMRRTLN